MCFLARMSWNCRLQTRRLSCWQSISVINCAPCWQSITLVICTGLWLVLKRHRPRWHITNVLLIEKRGETKGAGNNDCQPLLCERREEEEGLFSYYSVTNVRPM